MAVRELLRSCPLFFELYDKEIDKIVKKCSVHSFQQGEVIVRDGDEGEEPRNVLHGGPEREASGPRTVAG